MKKLVIWAILMTIVILYSSMVLAAPPIIKPMSEGDAPEPKYDYRKTLVSETSAIWGVELVSVIDNNTEITQTKTVKKTFTHYCQCTITSGMTVGVSKVTFYGQAGVQTGVTCGWSWTYEREVTVNVPPHSRVKVYFGIYGKKFVWKVEKIDLDTGEVVQVWYDIHYHATCEYTRIDQEPLP